MFHNEALFPGFDGRSTANPSLASTGGNWCQFSGPGDAARAPASLRFSTSDATVALGGIALAIPSLGSHTMP
jgi:hypothetical protein